MAMPKRMLMKTAQVFPAGVCAVSDTAPVRDYDAPTPAKGAERPQKRDRDTGLLVWSVAVLDLDPEARNNEKTVTVKILSEHKPVLPENTSGMPITPVEFVELEVSPYVKREGDFSRLAWTFTALGITAPGESDGSSARKPAAGSNGGSANSKAAA